MALRTLVPCLLHRPSCVYTQCTIVLPDPPLAQLHTMYISAQVHLVVLLFEPDSAGEHLQCDALSAALVHCVVHHLHPALRRPMLAASVGPPWLLAVLQSALPTHAAVRLLPHVLAQLSPTLIDQPLFALMSVTLLQVAAAVAAPASTLFAAPLLQPVPLVLAPLSLASALSATVELLHVAQLPPLLYALHPLPVAPPMLVALQLGLQLLHDMLQMPFSSSLFMHHHPR